METFKAGISNKENLDQAGILLNSIKNVKDIFDSDGYIKMQNGAKEQIEGITTIAEQLQVLRSRHVTKGSVSIKHSHPEWQLFLVNKGKVILHYKPGWFWKNHIIEAGSFFYVDSNVPHYHTFVKETDIISILIPANPIYPAGIKQ